MVRSLAIVVVLGAACGTGEFTLAAPSAQALPPSAPAALPDLQALAARVQSAPLDAASIPEPLIVGAKIGNDVVTSTMLSDPEMPDTLVVYFANWQASARARLLLDYARSVLAQSSPPSYSSLPAATSEMLKVQDAYDHSRLKRIVTRGHYGKDWAPFVEAYNRFRSEVLKRIPEGPPDKDTDFRVDQIARAQGLHRLVATLRINPHDTAEEMLRLVSESRARHSSIDSPFYTCNSEIHVKIWHPLAGTLVHSLDSPPTPDNSSVSAAIAKGLQELENRFRTWLQEHREATDEEKTAFVQRTADELGLIRLLTETNALGAPSTEQSQTTPRKEEAR